MNLLGVSFVKHLYVLNFEMFGVRKYEYAY